MPRHIASIALLLSAVVLSANAQTPRRMFAHPRPWPAMIYAPGRAPSGQLPQWAGGFTDLTGHKIVYTMVGADPSVSNATTHVKVVLIPVIFNYGATNGNMTFNPKKAKLNGNKSIMASLLSSPLFDDGADFTSGAIDLGQSQYVDDWQRADFWSVVGTTNPRYHTILDNVKAKGLKVLKVNVGADDGSVIQNPFGSGVVGTYPMKKFETLARDYIAAHDTVITPDVLAFFVSYDIYLIDQGCCIGGFHDAIGTQPAGQTFGYATVEDSSSGGFGQDIDAVSHEMAEWFADPFVDNRVYCQDNKEMEVADPLQTLPNGGTFPVTLNGFTWHPQSLVMLPYFGAPTATSANGWVALHDDIANVCPGQ